MIHTDLSEYLAALGYVGKSTMLYIALEIEVYILHCREAGLFNDPHPNIQLTLSL